MNNIHQTIYLTYHHRDLETFCGEIDDRMQGLDEYDLVVRSEVKDADGEAFKLWMRFVRSPGSDGTIVLGAGIRAILPATLPRKRVEVPLADRCLSSNVYDLRNGWQLAEHEGKTFGHVLRAVTAG